MIVQERVNQFWPLWPIRVVWLLIVALLGWQVSPGELPPAFVISVTFALILQLVLVGLALLKRLPSWHDLVSTFAAALVAATALLAFPSLLTILLFLGLVPVFDLAYSRGLLPTTALLILFPIAPITFLVTRGEMALELETLLLLGSWGASTVLLSFISENSYRRRSRIPSTVQPKEESLNSIVAKVAQLLATENNYQSILDALTRGGSQVIDRDSRRSQARAMALIFKPGTRELLTLVSHHNLDGAHANQTFELKGVLGRLLQDGEPIDTDSSHAPFDRMRQLQDYRILLFPLRTGIDIYGAAVFATREDARADDPEVVRTLIALTDQASLALHNAVLQQELRRDRDELLDSAEEARHQLARDLHDGPVQRVAAISMQLEFIKALMKRQPERALSEVEQLQQVAKQATQEMRTMLFTLRPIVLESEGLSAALATFIERLRSQDHLTVSFEADPLPRLDPKVEEVSFAIMQEAIGNAKKYANGAPIHVRLIKGQTMVVGQVEDEGPGFDLQGVTSNYATRASLGLLNMQERAAMVGGQLKIDTAPGRGTIVSLAVPIERR